MTQTDIALMTALDGLSSQRTGQFNEGKRFAHSLLEDSLVSVGPRFEAIESSSSAAAVVLYQGLTESRPVDDYLRAGSRLAIAAESSDRDAIPSFGNTR